MNLFGKTYHKVAFSPAADGFGSEFQAARNASAERGRRIGGAVARVFDTKNTAAKAGVAVVMLVAIATSGHMLGFVRGVVEKALACPKA